MAVLTDIFVSKYAERNSLYARLVVKAFGYLEKENITFSVVFNSQQHSLIYSRPKKFKKFAQI